MMPEFLDENMAIALTRAFGNALSNIIPQIHVEDITIFLKAFDTCAYTMECNIDMDRGFLHLANCISKSKANEFIGKMPI